MQAYLRIENPGVAPKEAFTLLGASTKRGNSGQIGQFGSGNKHGVAVCLRNKLDPVIFAGNLKMSFGTRPQNVDDGFKNHEFARVFVKFSGKEGDTSRSSTEDLGFVLEYGAADWAGIDLALREFISNSIDRAVQEGEEEEAVKWNLGNPGKWVNSSFVQDSYREEFNNHMKEYRKKARDFQHVTVDVVNENQVRAKTGTTRVFIPLSPKVLEFYNNLGKWFLHFSEPESLGKCILPKTNRNLKGRTAAVIYRRGVRVREFESSEVSSLFDYNLDNLEMDESRKVDDWKVRYAAARAVRDSDAETLAVLMNSFKTGPKWEHDFDQYGIAPDTYATASEIAIRSKVWQKAFEAAGGDDGVIATADNGSLAVRKGYKVLTAPQAFVTAAGMYGIRTPEKVLTQDDREGREVIEATPDAIAALDFVWNVVQTTGMTNGKDRPNVKCFTKIMEGGGQTLGFYRDGTVYVNTDIAGYGSLEGGQNVLTQQLLVTMMEEVAHWVTGATDNSRDFQDYVLNLAVKLAKAQAGIL